MRDWPKIVLMGIVVALFLTGFVNSCYKDWTNTWGCLCAAWLILCFVNLQDIKQELKEIKEKILKD